MNQERRRTKVRSVKIEPWRRQSPVLLTASNCAEMVRATKLLFDKLPILKDGYPSHSQDKSFINSESDGIQTTCLSCSSNICPLESHIHTKRYRNIQPTHMYLISPKPSGLQKDFKNLAIPPGTGFRMSKNPIKGGYECEPDCLSLIVFLF